MSNIDLYQSLQNQSNIVQPIEEPQMEETQQLALFSDTTLNIFTQLGCELPEKAFHLEKRFYQLSTAEEELNQAIESKEKDSKEAQRKARILGAVALGILSISIAVPVGVIFLVGAVLPTSLIAKVIGISALVLYGICKGAPLQKQIAKRVVNSEEIKLLKDELGSILSPYLMPIFIIKKNKDKIPELKKNIAEQKKLFQESENELKNFVYNNYYLVTNNVKNKIIELSDENNQFGLYAVYFQQMNIGENKAILERMEKIKVLTKAQDEFMAVYDRFLYKDLQNRTVATN